MAESGVRLTIGDQASDVDRGNELKLRLMGFDHGSHQWIERAPNAFLVFSFLIAIAIL